MRIRNPDLSPKNFSRRFLNPDSKPDATFFIFDMKIDYRIGTYFIKTPKLQIRMQHFCFIRLLMSGSGLTWKPGSRSNFFGSTVLPLNPDAGQRHMKKKTALYSFPVCVFRRQKKREEARKKDLEQLHGSMFG
jgi:hypothetical protein